MGPATDAPADASSCLLTLHVMLLSPRSASSLNVTADATMVGGAKAEPAVYGDLYLADSADVDALSWAINTMLEAALLAAPSAAVQKFGWVDACVGGVGGHCAAGERPSMAQIRSFVTDDWSSGLSGSSHNQMNHWAGTCALGSCASAADASVWNTTNVRKADPPLLSDCLIRAALDCDPIAIRSRSDYESIALDASNLDYDRLPSRSQVHVADGSLLPSQLRAHPVLTVMAIASAVARRVVPSALPSAPPTPPPPLAPSSPSLPPGPPMWMRACSAHPACSGECHPIAIRSPPVPAVRLIATRLRSDRHPYPSSG